MISHFFIRRPIFATVISIVLVIGGLVSLQALPTAKFPEISPPTVKVTAYYPGANAQVVAETVASPIEQEVNGVEGSIYMSSTSADDGSYSLTVTFEVGTDMDMAQVLVQNRVALAEPKLPEEVRRQGVTTKKQSTQIVQFITLYSDGEYDELYLSNYVSLYIKDELARVPGVGEVTNFGVGDYGMRIWLDPEQMKARELTTNDVAAAVQEQNVQVAAGQLGSQPAPAGTAFQYSISTLGRLSEPEQFEDIIIKTTDDGRIIRVGNIARVELGTKRYQYTSQFNGKPCAAIAIYQLPGANALEVAQGIEKKMAELSQAESFRGLGYEIPFDTTLFVESSIKEVFTTLWQAVVLVVIVIFIFLQDWRATIIPTVAIPVSLIGTFGVMVMLGFSINMLTLFGIVLAIGIVVDDAIVVVENTSRHLDNGLDPQQAAIQAMTEITGPVIATTLVLLAVFVPTAFMSGITGQLYRQFALTISGAVIISTLNALTLSPALCALLLRPSSDGGLKNFILFRWFNKAFDFTGNIYTTVIGGMVRVVAIVMILFLGLVALTGYGFTKLPTGFVPAEDQGYAFVDLRLPDAASLERTQQTMEQVNEIVSNTPGVANVVSVNGYSMLSGTGGSNLGMMIVIFKPWEERQTPEEQMGAILANLRKQLFNVPQAQTVAFIPPAIDGLGVAGGFQMMVQDRGDLGLQELQLAADGMVRAGGGQTTLQSLSTPFRADVPQLFAEVDRTKVKNLDLPLSDVFGTLQAYLGSAYVNDFNRFGRTYQVMLQADQDYRVDVDQIRKLEVRNRKGQMIPLGTVLDIEDTFGPQVINRYNLYPSAQINGEAAPGVSSGQALLLMEDMARTELPGAMGFEWTGMSYQERLQSGGGTIVIFGMAVIFVFLVLAAQYESWTSPAAVIAVVPLAVLGVVIALMASGMENNVYTQIGIVLLVALASKNAILIVEFARDERSQGKTIRESATEAAGLRFRAILMTAFSSILGFLPLVIATGAGAASRVAVGMAVVGGMIAATFFSLMFVPSFFVVFQGLQEVFRSKEQD